MSSRIGGGRGGGAPSTRERVSAIVPAGGTSKNPTYYPQKIVTVQDGEVIDLLDVKNKTKIAPTFLDNELGRFFVALREGKGGTFTLHPDDYVAIQGEVSPVKKEGITQSSIIVYVSGGRVVSTLDITDSANHIDKEILDENMVHVTSALQDQNQEQHGTWRISTQDFATLFEQHRDGFQFFCEVICLKDGTINVGDSKLLQGRHKMYNILKKNIDELLKLLEGNFKRTKDRPFMLREQDLEAIVECFPDKITLPGKLLN